MKNPADFRSLVVRRRDACVKFRDGAPAAARKEALQFYRGDDLALYGDSGPGMSTVVSRDTMEAVESLLPSLVKPFVASDEAVRFEPTGPEDEDGADQATDYCNFVFSTHNNAFKVIYDAMKDGLLFRLGVAKVVMEEVEEGSPESYDDLNDAQVEAVRTAYPDFAGKFVQDEATRLYSVTLPPKKVKRYCVHVVAPDEFLYEERLACLDAATFLGHRKTMTVGDLIDLGVDEEKARGLSAGDPSQEEDDRFEGEDKDDEHGREDLAREVTVDECYIRCDYSGEGVLEWRKVLLGGASSTELLNEAADDHPYCAWTPIPVPHKLVGLSIHDLTRDIQMNKTAVQREVNNAMYLANRPMREVVTDMVNIDDLLNPTVGGIVRVKQPGMINSLSSGGEAALGAAFQLIEYFDTLREARTGVTRYNQGMDTESLNKTATGMSIIANASQQRQELIARQFAEFLKDVFRKLLGLVSQHATESEFIRLRGQWVQVDPSDWKTSYDMTVTVGLGTNNKQAMVGNLMQLVALDEKIIGLQGGIHGPLLTAANVHEKLKRLVEAMDLKSADAYYTDPASLPPPDPAQEQPQQDPLAEAQLDAQTELQKAQIKADADRDIAAMKTGPLGLVV